MIFHKFLYLDICIYIVKKKESKKKAKIIYSIVKKKESKKRIRVFNSIFSQIAASWDICKARFQYWQEL